MASTSVSQPVPSSEYVGNRVFVFSIIFIPVQVICVVLRFLARYLIKKSWGFDDLIIVVSLIFQLIQAALCIGSVKHASVGYHETYVLAQPNGLLALETWGKYLLAIATVYFVSANLPKIAILIMYKNIFPQRYLRHIIYGVMGILIGTSIATTIVSLAGCNPFRANWEPTLPGAKCINKENFFRYGSVPNIVTDLAMLSIPLPVVWGLKASTRMKIGLTITFVIGSMGLITSIIRLTTFFRVNSFADTTYAASELEIWTQVEPGIYLIAACLATYRPLLERLGPGRWKGRATESEKSGYISHRGTGYRSRASKQSKGDTTTDDSIDDGIPLKVKSAATGGVRDLGYQREGFHKLSDASTGGDITVRTDITVNQRERRQEPWDHPAPAQQTFYTHHP